MEATNVSTNGNCIGVFASVTTNYWLRDVTKPIVMALLKYKLFFYQIVQTFLVYFFRILNRPLVSGLYFIAIYPGALKLKVFKNN